MHRFDRLSARPIQLILCTLLLIGCGVREPHPAASSRDLTPNHPRPREGELGIVYQNGVECLGEEAQPRAGDELYLSPQGDDSNPGTRAAPLGTLAAALCNLRPGQTLYLLPGVYAESVLLGDFGDPETPITLRGVIEGDRWPVLDGENSRSMGLALVESRNFVIENIEFRNYNDEGLEALLVDGLVIQDCRFVENGRASTDPDSDGEGFGLNLVGVRGALIEGNQAIGNGPNHERWLNYTLGTGINTYELFDSVIRGNTVSGTVGGGILVEDGENVLVENNIIEGNELDANGDYWDGGIWVDGSYNVTLRGNTIRDNHGPGMVLSDEDVQYPQTSYGIVVEGNTVSGNLTAAFLWNYGVCPPPEAAIRIEENDFSGNEDLQIWCSAWECGEGQPCE